MNLAFSSPSKAHRVAVSPTIPAMAEIFAASDAGSGYNPKHAGVFTRQMETLCQAHLEDKRIEGLLMAMQAERRAGFPTGPAFLRPIEFALATALQQACDVSGEQRTHKGGLSPSRLRRVIAMINTNMDRDLTLEALACIAGLSTSHFSRMFRIATSMSPHKFILHLRVERAGELLRQSNLRILDVALACGFKTQQHFARIFRKEFGVNPTEYRNLITSQRPNNDQMTAKMPSAI